MSCLLLEVGGVGRQLKYSRMGRRDSVGSTSTLRLGCFGRTHAMFAKSGVSLLSCRYLVERGGRMLALTWNTVVVRRFDDSMPRSQSR